jgi:hypothetical protein
MRRLLAVAVPALLLAGADSTSGLVGRWKSAEVSPANLSAVFEFGRDGVVDSYSSVIVEGRYRLLGTDTIILQSKDGHEEKQELEWDNQDRGRIEDEAAGKSIEISRAGKRLDPQNPLLGEWDTTREWSGKRYPARGLFFADGRNIWIINLRVETGRYSVKDGRIRLEIPDRPAIEGNFSVAEGSLMLPNPRGGQSRFNQLDSDYLAPANRR